VPAAAAEHHRRVQRADPRFTPEVVARIRALYYAKISHVDDRIGRILDVVRRRGWDASTAVLFWSDHGEMAGDKHRLYKSVFYEPSVRVPLILRTPERAGAGTLCLQPVSLVDAFPTLLELAGAPPRPAPFRRSLLPLTLNPAASHHAAVFSEIDDRTMVFDGRFKMVVNAAAELLKLYDLAADPAESRNLAGKPGTQETVARLRERLLEWFLATKLGQCHTRRPAG
jgi:arylsulfatase A-like enzyme